MPFLSTEKSRDNFAIASLMFSYLHDDEMPLHISQKFGLSIIYLLDRAIQSMPNFLEARRLREDTWHIMLKSNQDFYRQEYLSSSAWSDKKREVLARDNHKCVICNNKRNLEVHHRTYENIGKEPLSDLCILCQGCHIKYHTKMSNLTLCDKVEDIYQLPKPNVNISTDELENVPY